MFSRSDEVGFGPLLTQWREDDSRPHLIIDDALNILWSNAAADVAMAEHIDLAMVDGALVLPVASEMGDFRSFIAAASSATSAWCARGRQRPAVFEAWRVEADGVSAIGLTIRACDKAYAPRWADFSRVFGLTPAETRISMRLLDGLRVEEIAELTGISPGTARQHVRNLYLKLEVHSREALLRLLAPFQIV